MEPVEPDASSPETGKGEGVGGFSGICIHADMRVYICVNASEHTREHVYICICVPEDTNT